MNKKNRTAVRILAIVLAVLLAGSAIVSLILELTAYGEELMPPRDTQEAAIEYLPEEQALHITQRLVHYNTKDIRIENVFFFAAVNMFRRQSTLMYDADALEAYFPFGYTPGGIDLLSVTVDGKECDRGFRGNGEMLLRVNAPLEAGEKCEIVFEYIVLLTENRAFTGLDDTDLRLSDFLFIPLETDNEYLEPYFFPPLAYTRYIDTAPADYSVSITLPERWTLVSSGSAEASKNGDHTITYTVTAECSRSFALNILSGAESREMRTDSGVLIRASCFSGSASKRVLKAAEKAVEYCEEHFGVFPVRELEFSESGYAGDFYTAGGCVWLNSKLLTKKNADELEHAVRFAAAQQYFGLSASPRAVSDAWLSDAVCEYLSYLMLENEEGGKAYYKALNEEVVPALQLTIPGGLTVTSSAELFTADEYDLIVLKRGSAVFHEMRVWLGLDELIEGFRIFYEKGRNGAVLTETDLVDALDEASGTHCEKTLTELVFNIGDYVDQSIFWLD